jgi:hypothetical protein
MTTDGFWELPYESPSQSDDGMILAARGEKFVKLDRHGTESAIRSPPSSLAAALPADNATAQVHTAAPRALLKRLPSRRA